MTFHVVISAWFFFFSFFWSWNQWKQNQPLHKVYSESSQTRRTKNVQLCGSFNPIVISFCIQSNKRLSAAGCAFSNGYLYIFSCWGISQTRMCVTTLITWWLITWHFQLSQSNGGGFVWGKLFSNKVFATPPHFYHKSLGFMRDILQKIFSSFLIKKNEAQRIFESTAVPAVLNVSLCKHVGTDSNMKEICWEWKPVKNATFRPMWHILVTVHVYWQLLTLHTWGPIFLNLLLQRQIYNALLLCSIADCNDGRKVYAVHTGADSGLPRSLSNVWSEQGWGDQHTGTEEGVQKTRLQTFWHANQGK